MRKTYGLILLAMAVSAPASEPKQVKSGRICQRLLRRASYAYCAKT